MGHAAPIMLDGAWTQIGVNGIFALLLVKMCFDFMAQRRTRQNGFAAINWAKLVQEISDLHNWHAKTDNDGTFVWYVRKSLEDAVRQLAENIDKQTDLLRQQTEVLQAVMRDVAEVHRKVAD